MDETPDPACAPHRSEMEAAAAALTELSAATTRHLDACERCRRHHASAQQIARRMRALGGPTVAQDQLRRLVDAGIGQWRREARASAGLALLALAALAWFTVGPVPPNPLAASLLAFAAGMASYAAWWSARRGEHLALPAQSDLFDTLAQQLDGQLRAIRRGVPILALLTGALTLAVVGLEFGPQPRVVFLAGMLAAGLGLAHQWWVEQPRLRRRRAALVSMQAHAE